MHWRQIDSKTFAWFKNIVAAVGEKDLLFLNADINVSVAALDGQAASLVDSGSRDHVVSFNFSGSDMTKQFRLGRQQIVNGHTEFNSVKRRGFKFSQRAFAEGFDDFTFFKFSCLLIRVGQVVFFRGFSSLFGEEICQVL